MPPAGQENNNQPSDTQASPGPAPGSYPNPANPNQTSSGFLEKVKSKFSNKKTRFAAILFTAVFAIAGGAAAAFYGVYVPNKPENVLTSSVKNELQSSTQSGKGSASFTAPGSPAVTLDYSLQNDSANKAFGAQVEASISGVKIPFEFRAVDRAAYLKVGDLSTVKSLASSFAGEEGAVIINELSDKVADKWIEFDESLLKTASQGQQECDLFGVTFSNEQIDQIFEVYKDNKFVTITNSSTDEVDGKKVAKYDLNLDGPKAKEFAGSLKGVEAFNKLEACSGGDGGVSTDDEFNGTIETTAWVDKGSKQLVKIAVKSSDDQGTFTADFTFTDEDVNITKPEGAIPALQLLGDLGSFFGIASGSSGPSNSGSGGATGGFSQECIEAYQKFSESQGRSSIPTECTQ